LRLFSFGGYGLALAALALVVCAAYDSYPNSLGFDSKMRFCVFQAASAWLAYQRFRQGAEAAFAPSYEADPTAVPGGAPYSSYPDAEYQEPPFSGSQNRGKFSLKGRPSICSSLFHSKHRTPGYHKSVKSGKWPQNQ